MLLPAAASGIILFLISLFVVLFDITWKGAGVLSWEFLVSIPPKGMTEGGIYPALAGTVMVTMITALFSIPVGFGADQGFARIDP